MSLQFELTPTGRREVVAAARCLKAALPSAAAMKLAAIEHLRVRGRVRFPLEAGRPTPEDWFASRVLRVAATGDARESVTLPFELRWHVEYHMPVRIETPWGAISEFVALKRSWDGATWGRSSAPVDSQALKRRALASRYRFILMAVPDQAAARSVLTAARKAATVLRHDVWDLDGLAAAEDRWTEPMALREKPSPSSLGSRSSPPYERFVRDRTSRRRITSRGSIPLTRDQQEAAGRFDRIVSNPFAEDRVKARAGKTRKRRSS